VNIVTVVVRFKHLPIGKAIACQLQIAHDVPTSGQVPEYVRISVAVIAMVPVVQVLPSRVGIHTTEITIVSVPIARTARIIAKVSRYRKAALKIL
jgi:hypothetical protein